MENENKKPSNPYIYPDPMRGAESSYSNQSPWELNQGMSLRDYFANSASRAIPIKQNNRGFRTDKDYDEWAEECYKRADALLKQREL
ncbi:MAG TPA: hypothetical protein VJ780_06235 [Flavobacterium sp.]|nr:hypothetical protein [Flavobacterium sp.]